MCELFPYKNVRIDNINIKFRDFMIFSSKPNTSPNINPIPNPSPKTLKPVT